MTLRFRDDRRQPPPFTHGTTRALPAVATAPAIVRAIVHPAATLATPSRLRRGFADSTPQRPRTLVFAQRRPPPGTAMIATQEPPPLVHAVVHPGAARITRLRLPPTIAYTSSPAEPRPLAFPAARTRPSPI